MIYGGGFPVDPAVKFGNAFAAGVMVTSATELSCITPPGAALGAVDVTLSTHDGRLATLTGGFTYVSRPWFYSQRPVRRSFTVVGTPGQSLGDFQVRCTIPFDADMRSDFGDLLFTQLQGGVESPVPHWIESFIASTQASVWLKIPFIPIPPATARMNVYYGDSQALSASSFEFVFTKDFGEGGLLGLWHTDEGTGSWTMDSSGGGNHGQLSGFVLPLGWADVDGGGWETRSDVGFAEGSFLRFDGEDDVVDFGPGVTRGVTNALSVEGWVRNDRTSICGTETVIASAWKQKSDFTSGWEVHIPDPSGNPMTAGGYMGAVFDGRYLYFVPHFRTAPGGYHDEVLRFDTQGGFTQATSWETFLPGLTAGGHYGGVFDGRYVYFAPYYNSMEQQNGRVLRYDTQQTFTLGTSWEEFYPFTQGVGDYGKGYIGAVFDGRYVYFVPHHDGNAHHGEVLRYDTQSPFSEVPSWAAYDPGDHGVGNDPDGYHSAVFDGRYIYFVPYHNGSENHGEVLRFDTLSDFTSASSWTTFDPDQGNIGSDPDGYAGGVFDGRYVYFTPGWNETTAHGEFLRYDTLGNFSEASSWRTADPGVMGVGTELAGYWGGGFDGRYLYFVPYVKSVADTHGKVLRFDSRGAFTDPASWTVYDTESMNGAEGFIGMGFDGRFLYLCPYLEETTNVHSNHCNVMRYDTTAEGGSFKLCASSPDWSGGFGGGPFSTMGRIQTATSVFTVAANQKYSPGTWHHVAMAYDGATLRLFVDGVLKDSRNASGDIVASPSSFLFGNTERGRGFFRGAIDEVRIYDRALSEDEVRAHAQRRKFASPEPQASALGPEERR
jgi:hypothetical protein